MTSIQTLISDLREQVTCSVCMNVLTDPKQLYCLHSFCFQCLQRWHRTSQLSTNNRQDTIICPNCRAPSGVPESSDLNDLPTSSYLMGLIDVLAIKECNKTKVTCGNCDAKICQASYCFQCCIFYCEECVTAHNKMRSNKDHRALALRKFQEKDYEDVLKRPAFCPKQRHQNEELKYYCKNCKIAVCQSCFALEHSGHTLEYLEDEAEREKVEIKTLIKPRKENLQAEQNIIDQLDEDYVKVIQHGEDMKKNAQLFAESLIAVINTKKETIFAEVEKQIEKSLENITTRRSELENDVNEKKSTLEKMEKILTHGSNAEIIQLKNSLENVAVKNLQTKPMSHHPEDLSAMHVVFSENQQLFDAINSDKIGSLEFQDLTKASTSNCDAVELNEEFDGPQVPIEVTLNLAANTELKRCENRWVRYCERSKPENPEELKTEELYRKVRSILNRLTLQKFQTLTLEMLELEIDTAERLEGVVDLIFRKAICEAAFSVAYANLCRCLLPKKVVTEVNGVERQITFHKFLLTKCQQEFEKICNEGLNEDLQHEERELVDEECQSKQQRLGNIRFIGELFKLKMLTASIMHDVLVKLLNSSDEFSLECLCKLLITIGKDLDHAKMKPRVDQYFSNINDIIQARIISSRVRFMMEDITELRNNDWVPLVEDDNPTAIDQIHEEAGMQAKTALRGSTDCWYRRDNISPGEGGAARKKDKQRVRKKLRENEQRFQLGDAQGYIGSRESNWGTPGTASTAKVTVPVLSFTTARTKLSGEAIKRISLSIVDEYLNICDWKEAIKDLKELQSPWAHHFFVVVAFNHTLEKTVSDRNATGKLLLRLLEDGVLTARRYLNGLDQIFECAEDTELDIPQLWKYLGEMMAPTLFSGKVDLDEAFKRVLRHVPKQKAAKLFAHMLQFATNDTSREHVSAVLGGHNLTLENFFSSEEQARKFARDENIDFVFGQASGSSQVASATSKHSAAMEEELRTLIVKKKARNDEVFAWIDQNVPAADTNESPFIRALVTAVCEEAMQTEFGGCSVKCNIDKLKDRRRLLRSYINDNTSVEVQALYAVQALFVRLDYPPGFIKSYFDCLYDVEIITEEAFHAWECSSDDELGKEMAVTTASQFFLWLNSASWRSGQEY